MSEYKRKNRKSDKPLTTEEKLLIENERLRCVNQLLKKLQEMELRHKFHLELFLDLTKMARSSFYYHQKQNKLPNKYIEIKELIKELIKAIHQRHKGRYGYRRITDELQNRAMIINHKTVFRLMKLLELKSIIRLKKYKSYKGDQGKIAPNVLKRNFKAFAPNQKWATNITEFNVSGQKLYLSPIID